MDVESFVLSNQLRRIGYAGLAEVADEIEHPSRGRRGFPGHRTVGEQRALMLTVLRALVYEHDRTSG